MKRGWLEDDETTKAKRRKVINKAYAELVDNEAMAELKTARGW
jgi:hypothetical protein